MARKALTVETHFYIAHNRTAWVLLSYSSLWHKENFQKVLVMQKAKTSFMSEMVSWNSVHFSSVPWLIGSLGGHEGPFSRDPLPVLSAGGHCEQFWYGQGCPLFDVVHPAFSLPTTALPILHGALIDGFGEAVMACDMQEPCKFLFLDSCQKRFLWTHKEVDLALHSVVGPLLQVGDAEKFPQSLGFESLGPFFLSQQTGYMFFTHREGWR